MDQPAEATWQELVQPEWIAVLTVLLGGILLNSMNVLLIATVMPSIVADVGGAALMSWPTIAYSASSILASACGALVVAALGASAAYVAGAVIFGIGTLACAFAAGMEWVIVGRFVQGLGGGLLAALAYVLVRNVFPVRLWPRAFAALAGVWSVSVVVGPLVGGVFADHGLWRGAFFTVAGIAVLLTLLAARVLPESAGDGGRQALPGIRLGLVLIAIVLVSLASIATSTVTRLGLTLAAGAALGWMLRLNRTASVPLLPSDAFSLATPLGVGLWLAVLVSIAFTPLQVYGPVFLQRLHELSPLSAGYLVAAGSLAWTVAAVVVSYLPARWARQWIVIGPASMAAGLGGMGLTLADGPLWAVTSCIALLGAGIGCCWASIARFSMEGAAPGQENVAAAAVPTVQLMGLAFGGAAVGLIANAAGFAAARMPADFVPSATWVYLGAAVFAVFGVAAGLRLQRISA